MILVRDVILFYIVKNVISVNLVNPLRKKLGGIGGAWLVVEHLRLT